MMKTIFLLFSILLSASYAQAQTRVLAKVDATKGSVSGLELNWFGAEAEVEKSFKKKKLFLSGFAIGLRREAVPSGRWDEGVYFTFRTFRKQRFFKKHPVELIPSVAVLYGSPGMTLNRTTQATFGEFVPYTSVFPLRNADLPEFDIKKGGLIYPELSVAVRKEFLKILSIEPVIGVRVIRFGVVQYDGVNSNYREDMALLPTLGLRVGLRIH